MREKKRAVVIGAGIAGLLSARVLSDVFDEVLVLDRDKLQGAAPRRGVPQGAHVHGLLARGHEILCDLFPGFTEELVSAGAIVGDLGQDVKWYFNGLSLQQSRAEVAAIAATRPLLESIIRKRVSLLDGVQMLSEHSVSEYLISTDGTTVVGVGVQGPDGGLTLHADLVIDAAGRGSRTPAILARFGYPKPSTHEVVVDLTYTTRYYRELSEDVLGDNQTINTVSGPATPRGAFFSAMEDGLHVVSLTGTMGERPPTDDAGFMQFARSLPTDEIHRAIENVTPVTPTTAFTYPRSIKRRYHRLDRFPDGLLVIGDALCSFNPVYGQGMTVSAQQALILRDNVCTGVASSRNYFREVYKVIDQAWDISAGGDLDYPERRDTSSLKYRAMNAYLRRVHRAAHKDGEITRIFMRVAGMVEKPTALFGWRVLRSLVAGR